MKTIILLSLLLVGCNSMSEGDRYFQQAKEHGWLCSDVRKARDAYKRSYSAKAETAASSMDSIIVMKQCTEDQTSKHGIIILGII
jgi:hypothetical protein